MTRVFAALPNAGWLQTDLFLNCFHWLKEGCYFFPLSGVRPAAMAYNTCIQAFLDDDSFTHLWFLNHDTVPPIDAMKVLLDADKDLVSGVTPTMKEDSDGVVKPVLMVCRHVEGVDFMPITGEGLVPIDACGTACFMIKRKVLEAIPAPWYEERNWHGQIAGDFGFCRKASAKGFEIFAHFDVRCVHRKEVDL